VGSQPAKVVGTYELDEPATRAAMYEAADTYPEERVILVRALAVLADMRIFLRLAEGSSARVEISVTSPDGRTHRADVSGSWKLEGGTVRIDTPGDPPTYCRPEGARLACSNSSRLKLLQDCVLVRVGN
jgi:hypothetical protein